MHASRVRRVVLQCDDAQMSPSPLRTRTPQHTTMTTRSAATSSLPSTLPPVTCAATAAMATTITGMPRATLTSSNSSSNNGSRSALTSLLLQRGSTHTHAHTWSGARGSVHDAVTHDKQQQEVLELGTPWVAPAALCASRHAVATATTTTPASCHGSAADEAAKTATSTLLAAAATATTRSQVSDAGSATMVDAVALRVVNNSAFDNKVDDDDDDEAGLDAAVDAAVATTLRRRRERRRQRLRDIEATLTRDVAAAALTTTTTTTASSAAHTASPQPTHEHQQRGHAVCVALEAVGREVPAVQSVLRHVSRAVREMAAALQHATTTRVDALAAQERELLARGRAFYAEKLTTLLRERARVEQTVQQLRDELLAVRRARDEELTQVKEELLRRLSAYERREQDVNHYRQLIATVFSANERLTHYNEQLEAALRKHRIHVPTPPPDVFAFAGKSKSNNGSSPYNNNGSDGGSGDDGSYRLMQRHNTQQQHEGEQQDSDALIALDRQHASGGNNNGSDYYCSHDDDDEGAVMRPLTQQVPIAFIAASREEMNAARLTLQKELLHCAFDQRSAYRMQLSGLQHDKDALLAKVHALEERVTELSSYIYEKRYRGSRRQRTQHAAPASSPPQQSPPHGDDAQRSTALVVATATSPSPSTQVRSLDVAAVASKQPRLHSREDKSNNSNDNNDDDNDDSDADELLTPRPRDVPFAIQTELGVDLKESTAHVVAELAAVSVNLKHQLNSALLRLRQMATLVEWADEAVMRDVDAMCNEVGVLPLYTAEMWPYIPHFLRTRLGSNSGGSSGGSSSAGAVVADPMGSHDAPYAMTTAATTTTTTMSGGGAALSGVPNLRWSATTTAALLRELFDRYNELREECRYVRDGKMLAPRNYQLAEHAQRRLARVDATRDEVARSAEAVPFGYVVSHFVRRFLLRMSRDEVARTLQTVLPATVHPCFAVQGGVDAEDGDGGAAAAATASTNSSNSGGGGAELRVVELEFARFAYNLWWAAQHHARAQPLCELFCRVVDGQAPVTLYAQMQHALARVRRCVDALDVDGSGLFTYARLASGVQQMTAQLAAHDTHRGLLAVAQTFEGNALSTVGARLRRLPLFADETYCMHDTSNTRRSSSNGGGNGGHRATLVTATSSHGGYALQDKAYEVHTRSSAAAVSPLPATTTRAAAGDVAAAATAVTTRSARTSTCALVTTHLAPPGMPLGASVFVRYWRALVLHYALATYDVLERLLLPLVRESAVVLGVYLLPVGEAVARLRSIDAAPLYATAAADVYRRERGGGNALTGTARDARTHLRHLVALPATPSRGGGGAQDRASSGRVGLRQDKSSGDKDSDADNDDDDDGGEGSEVPVMAGMTHEYAQLLEQRHHVLQRARTAQCLALEEMFVRAVEALPRLSAAIHFPFEHRGTNGNDDDGGGGDNGGNNNNSGSTTRRPAHGKDASRPRSTAGTRGTSATRVSARGGGATATSNMVLDSTTSGTTAAAALSSSLSSTARATRKTVSGKSTSKGARVAVGGSAAASTTNATATATAPSPPQPPQPSMSPAASAALALFAPRTRELVEWYSFCARLRAQVPRMHADLFAHDDDDDDVPGTDKHNDTSDTAAATSNAATPSAAATTTTTTSDDTDENHTAAVDSDKVRADDKRCGGGSVDEDDKKKDHGATTRPASAVNTTM